MKEIEIGVRVQIKLHGQSVTARIVAEGTFFWLWKRYLVEYYSNWAEGHPVNKDLKWISYWKIAYLK